MATTFSAWNSHAWSNRLMDLRAGIRVVQHFCGKCARNFVYEELTGEWYALHAGIHALEKLSNDATERWLTEPCPGQRPDSDETDLKMRFV
jgi:hypothetical protein